MQYRNPQGEWTEKPADAVTQWRPSAYGIVVRDQKILCIKADWTNKWALPGGAVEMDEYIVDAVKREMVEETPYSVVGLEETPFHIHETFFCDTLVRNPPEWRHAIVMVFKAEVGKEEERESLGVEAGEVEVCAWIPLEDLTEQTVHYAFWPAVKKYKECVQK